MDALWVATELAMWAKPNSGGYMAMVTAKRTELAGLAEWSLLTGLRTVGCGARNPPDYSYTIESVTENRAVVTVRDAYRKGPEEILLYHQVFLVGGGFLYTVFYSYDSESNSALESVFRASADSIVLTGVTR